MSEQSKKPLIVSIVGAPHIGVTTACGRVQRCLNAQGVAAEVLTLDRNVDVMDFEDDYLLGNYMHLDVILFDKHRCVESAVKRRLRQTLWDDESVMPDLSVLLSSSMSWYQQALRDHSDRRKKATQHEAYLCIDRAHYGTRNHHMISLDGRDGQLYAAGTIKSLILRELKR